MQNILGLPTPYPYCLQIPTVFFTYVQYKYVHLILSGSVVAQSAVALYILLICSWCFPLWLVLHILDIQRRSLLKLDLIG